jgi:hypothetical protein
VVTEEKLQVEMLERQKTEEKNPSDPSNPDY